jgi:hypothetical protein
VDLPCFSKGRERLRQSTTHPPSSSPRPLSYLASRTTSSIAFLLHCCIAGHSSLRLRPLQAPIARLRRRVRIVDERRFLPPSLLDVSQDGLLLCFPLLTALLTTNHTHDTLDTLSSSTSTMPPNSSSPPAVEKGHGDNKHKQNNKHGDGKKLSSVEEAMLRPELAHLPPHHRRAIAEQMCVSPSRFYPPADGYDVLTTSPSPCALQSLRPPPSHHFLRTFPLSHSYGNHPQLLWAHLRRRSWSSSSKPSEPSSLATSVGTDRLSFFFPFPPSSSIDCPSPSSTSFFHRLLLVPALPPLPARHDSPVRKAFTSPDRLCNPPRSRHCGCRPLRR